MINKLVKEQKEKILQELTEFYGIVVWNRTNYNRQVFDTMMDESKIKIEKHFDELGMHLEASKKVLLDKVVKLELDFIESSDYEISGEISKLIGSFKEIIFGSYDFREIIFEKAVLIYTIEISEGEKIMDKLIEGLEEREANGFQITRIKVGENLMSQIKELGKIMYGEELMKVSDSVFIMGVPLELKEEDDNKINFEYNQ